LHAPDLLPRLLLLPLHWLLLQLLLLASLLQPCSQLPRQCGC
jgi:hypothetical protein